MHKGIGRRVALAAGLALAGVAHARGDYPSRAIRMVVPFTAGSTSDVTSRLVAQAISGPLGQPVVVENRPGANGIIGMGAVAKSAPDGYTLVVGSVSTTVVPAVLSKSPPFDLFRDFTAVSVMANTPLLLTVNRDSAIASVAGLVARAKREPGRLTYGNSAGLYQLAMELLNKQAGIDLVAVAYKGPPEAVTDLLAGRLTVAPDSLGSATRNIVGGRTRALATLGSTRTASLADVPTMLELGYRDFEFNGWIGLLAPAGVPEPVVQRLGTEIARALATEDVRQRFAALGLEPAPIHGKEYAAMLSKELARYSRIVREAGIDRQ